MGVVAGTWASSSFEEEFPSDQELIDEVRMAGGEESACLRLPRAEVIMCTILWLYVWVSGLKLMTFLAPTPSSTMCFHLFF